MRFWIHHLFYNLTIYICFEIVGLISVDVLITQNQILLPWNLPWGNEVNHATHSKQTIPFTSFASRPAVDSQKWRNRGHNLFRCRQETLLRSANFWDEGIAYDVKWSRVITAYCLLWLLERMNTSYGRCMQMHLESSWWQMIGGGHRRWCLWKAINSSTAKYDML